MGRVSRGLGLLASCSLAFLGGYLTHRPPPVPLLAHEGAVYVWPLGLGPDATAAAHLSLTLSDGTYVSWYPDELAKSTPAQDVRVYGSQHPRVYFVPIDHPERIVRWWKHVHLTADDNCGATVLQALAVGGALPPFAARWINPPAAEDAIKGIGHLVAWDLLTDGGS